MINEAAYLNILKNIGNSLDSIKKELHELNKAMKPRTASEDDVKRWIREELQESLSQS